MDVERLYDEFGNYIGPDKSDEESDESDDSLQLPNVEAVIDTGASLPNDVSIDIGLQGREGNTEKDNLETPAASVIQDDSSAVGSSALNGGGDGTIVLAEDKQLYPRADEVFGSGTEVLVEEEDAQPLSEPLVAAPEEHSSGLYEKPGTVPAAKYSRGYLAKAVAPFPPLVRNVAIVGHIHHGKTSLVDMLFCGTHDMAESQQRSKRKSFGIGKEHSSKNDGGAEDYAYDDDDDDDRRESSLRYTDLRFDERQLGISIKTCLMTLLLQNSDGKSYGVTILDTPGHMNFRDEVAASLTITDGIVVVVDVAEGVMMGTKSALREAARLGLSIVLVISKLDRLCLELRLPPTDAYHKIQHIIDACNEVISTFPDTASLSPVAGNVCFSSASERVCFTLPQFARAYIRANGGPKSFPLTERQLARRLWGNVYYDVQTRKFCERSTGSTGASGGSINLLRTFVSFVLEPFYKLHTAVVSEDVDELAGFLKRNMLLNGNYAANSKHMKNGNVRKAQLNSNMQTTLKAVNSQCFGMGDLSGFTDMLVEHVKTPGLSGDRMLRTLGHQIALDNVRDAKVTEKMKTFDDWQRAIQECDTSPKSAMSAYVSKLIPDERGMRFDCVCRVLSGTIEVGDSIHILGSTSNVPGAIREGRLGGRVDDDMDGDEDDMTVGKVEALFLNCARFKIRISQAVAGQIVLVRGIDRTIDKSATLVSTDVVRSLGAKLCRRHALRSIMDFIPPPVVKVAIEPIKPAHLPKMVSLLRMCVGAYPGLVTRVEHTGEHVLMGSGELYLDCVLRDLREAFGKVEVKVSDPVVPFAETVSETSALQCASNIVTGLGNDSEDENENSNSRKGRLVTVAEPLEESIIQAVETGQFETPDETQRAGVLRDLGWDALAAKSLWAFGPDEYSGTNALLNDVLGNAERQRAGDLRDSVVHGFCWAMREGPLCDEPVRGVKVRVLDATPPSSSSGGSFGGGVIATSRRVIFSSMLTACPQMLEPVNEVEIVLPTEAVRIASTLVTRRRGLIVGQEDLAATPLVRMTVHMPVLDSFGFEPDLRSLTHGAAFCSQSFSNWRAVPGDPLDCSISLRPLEPAARHELAREVMIKTRRRKGLGDDVSVTKYLDDPLFAELAADNEELRRLM